jgi:hypothetical protein
MGVFEENSYERPKRTSPVQSLKNQTSLEEVIDMSLIDRAEWRFS